MWILFLVVVAFAIDVPAPMAADWAHGEHAKLGTQDADPLGAGSVQLQFNGGYDRSSWPWQSPPRDVPQHYEGAISFVLTYGVTDRLDLGVETGHGWLADDGTHLRAGHGVSDARASAKWRILENEEQRLAIAFVPSLAVPTGRENSHEYLGPGQGHYSLDTRFAIVRDWSATWSTNLDAGYEAFFDDENGSPGVVSANVAVGWQVLPRLQPEAELNYSLVTGGDRTDLLSVTVGAVLPLSDRICLRSGVHSVIAGRDPVRSNAVMLSTDFNM